MVCSARACCTPWSSHTSSLPHRLFPALHLVTDIEDVVHSADGITEALWWESRGLIFHQGWNWGTQSLASGSGSCPSQALSFPHATELDLDDPLLAPPLWPSRCWFGKRPGVYTDYIYQGPMILVLLVRTWGRGQERGAQGGGGQSVPTAGPKDPSAKKWGCRARNVQTLVKVEGQQGGPRPGLPLPIPDLSTHSPPETWVHTAPPVLTLQINFLFLFNIVRILMTKLRASTTSETIQYR